MSIIHEETTMDAVTAVRIEGKIDLINERHERFTEDMTDVKTRLNGHSDRLNKLEAYKDKAEGVSSAVRVMWLAGGAIIGTVITVGIAAFSYLTGG